MGAASAQELSDFEAEVTYYSNLISTLHANKERTGNLLVLQEGSSEGGFSARFPSEGQEVPVLDWTKRVQTILPSCEFSKAKPTLTP